MGLMDKLKATMGDTDAQLRVETQANAKRQLKDQIERHESIKFVSGKELVNGSFFGSIYQLNNGEVVFNIDTPINFIIRNMDFAGPSYHEETKTTGKVKTKKKRHGLAGSVVGTVLAPGVGTIAGAVVGHGMGKDKTADNRDSSTYQVEDDSNLTLTLENVETKETIVIGLAAKQADYQKLLNFKVFPIEAAATVQIENDTTSTPIETTSAQSVQTIDNTMVAELKQLKELLDEEIITQDEFDQKKKQLLNL